MGVCNSKKEEQLNNKEKKDNSLIYYLGEKRQNLSANDVEIIFTTSKQSKIKIIIDSNKTMGELIKTYFKKIKRLDLFGDSTIIFLIDAKTINHDSNDLIKNYINKENINNVILVFDQEDKIYM